MLFPRVCYDARVAKRPNNHHQSHKRATLAGYLNVRVEELRRIVPAALNEWDVTAIHQSRVATRRLKAAWDDAFLQQGRKAFQRVQGSRKPYRSR